MIFPKFCHLRNTFLNRKTIVVRKTTIFVHLKSASHTGKKCMYVKLNSYYYGIQNKSYGGHILMHNYWVADLHNK